MPTEELGGAIMTSPPVDQITTEADSTSLQPAEPYSPPPATRSSSRPSAWVPLFQSRERRWWTIALAATLLVTAFGIGVLYVDDSNTQASIRSITTQNDALTGRHQTPQHNLHMTQR